MNGWDFNRYALCSCVVAAMLAGCSVLPLSLSKGQDEMQPPIGAPASSGYGSLAKSPAHSKTFVFTGEAQSFTVPAGVRSLTVVARGAAGASIVRALEEELESMPLFQSRHKSV